MHTWKWSVLSGIKFSTQVIVVNTPGNYKQPAFDYASVEKKMIN
jgi:hypothetical protein